MRVKVGTVAHAIRRLGEERGHRLRFVASRVLWRTGLGERLALRTELEEGISVRFAGSSLAAAFWLDPMYGREERRAIGRLLDDGECFVDVGANIGVLAMVGAVAVGPRGRVLALEPHPRTFTRLVANVRDNGLDWIRCLQVAAGRHAGTSGFSDLRTDDQNQVAPVDGASLTVSVQPLDQLTREFEDIALLKIDVEGYEQAVLDGGKATLRRTRTVSVECSRRLSAQHGLDVDAVLEQLEVAGFSLLDADELRPVPRPWPHDEPRNVFATRDTEQLRDRLLGP